MVEDWMTKIKPGDRLWLSPQGRRQGFPVPANPVRISRTYIRKPRHGLPEEPRMICVIEIPGRKTDLRLSAGWFLPPQPPAPAPEKESNES